MKTAGNICSDVLFFDLFDDAAIIQFDEFSLVHFASGNNHFIN